MHGRLQEAATGRAWEKDSRQRDGTVKVMEAGRTWRVADVSTRPCGPLGPAGPCGPAGGQPGLVGHWAVRQVGHGVMNGALPTPKSNLIYSYWKVSLSCSDG